jgi:2-succinyl-5-enolpyruvyl-6-hydroxy-3-cyclohexene-1-carboxylate synthase
MPHAARAGAVALPQVKLFGGYVRWSADMPAPSAAIPARYVVATAGEAFAAATGPSPGPVHLNCQLREPLAPTPAAWPLETLRVRGDRVPSPAHSCCCCC